LVLFVPLAGLWRTTYRLHFDSACMSQTQTSHTSYEHPQFLILRDTEVKDGFSNTTTLFDHDPMDLVDMALLQSGGVELVEWRSRLYCRMGIQVIHMVCINQP
jgi:hypothetical protein